MSAKPETDMTDIELDVAEQTTEEAAPQDEFKEKYLRLMAEMENLRKRTEKEVADAKKYAVSNFARELLTVQDNADRALAACQDDKTDVKTIATGVEMVVKQLSDALGRFQIEKITSVGEAMNPDLHQVMQEVEDAQAAPGTIVQELQPGYTIAGRLLRPALVITAKSSSGESK